MKTLNIEWKLLKEEQYSTKSVEYFKDKVPKVEYRTEHSSAYTWDKYLMLVTEIQSSSKLDMSLLVSVYNTDTMSDFPVFTFDKHGEDYKEAVAKFLTKYESKYYE